MGSKMNGLRVYALKGLLCSESSFCRAAAALLYSLAAGYGSLHAMSGASECDWNPQI